MKSKKQYILIFCVLFLFGACDTDFVEINTNPYAVTDIDPAILFAGAQRTHLGTYGAEHTIVQQFVNPYNQGATLGFNFNADIDGVNNPMWDNSYPATIRNMVQAMTLLEGNTQRVNLLSMIRIWKAQTFMGLVDTYADVPYFEAGKAVSEGIFSPVYDDDAAIYDDLYKEITEALAAFNTSGDFVSADLFYGANAEIPSANATAQVAKWKKLGNSLLLRLGMRYSKINAAKAQAIVGEALAGGVMTSNDDNAYVKYDGSTFVQATNNNLRNFSQFNYAAEPFVDQMKNTNDPRGKFIFATFADPGQVGSEPNPDTNLANQFGVPVGVDEVALANTGLGYRGTRGGGLNYSQYNIWVASSPAAPDFWVTYAQTSLLLAEAAKRGWVPGGDAQAKIYYDNAIAADMAVFSLYPGTTPISGPEVTAYLAEPGVAYNATDALELINTQYWIVSFRNGTEAFANFRRSGFPALTPNTYNNDLQGGFARRMTYPDREGSSNVNYQAAVAAIGGSDNLTARVFWDN